MKHSTGPDLRGLYAVTSAAVCAEDEVLRAAVAAALAGGARMIQYRDKLGSAARREIQARALLELCNENRALLVINDDIDLAQRIRAHGVHLGATDAPLARARERLGPDMLLGASCGGDPARAQTAVASGADYVALGRFFDSRTKPQAPPAALESLRQARMRLRDPHIPICAIGGLTPGNAGALIAAGADLIAAVDGVFGNPSPAAVTNAARAYCKLFETA